MIDFTVYGKPEPGGSKKAFLPLKKEHHHLFVGAALAGGLLRPVVVDANSKAKAWQAEVKKAAEQAMAMRDPLLGPLHVEFVFGLERPKSVKREEPTVRPDVTKLIRAVEDACTGIVWKDDAQIIRQIASKVYAAGQPFVRVIVHG